MSILQLSLLFQTGGASSTFSLAPTKTLNVAGDIRADHPDVYLLPVPIFQIWHEAKPRTSFNLTMFRHFGSSCLFDVQHDNSKLDGFLSYL